MDSWDSPDSAKLAMKRIVRLLNLLSVDLPEDSSFLKTARNPEWRRRFLQRWPRHYALGRYMGLLGRVSNGRPTLITDREWDVLIVLDACRWDTFCKVYGEAPSIISPGTCTGGWVRENFFFNPSKNDLHDVTLVTSNPINSIDYFNMNGRPFPFRGCINVWRDGWDDDLRTVTPEAMVEFTHRAMETNPPRLLIHFLQPHVPFIGEPAIKTDLQGISFLRGVDRHLDTGAWKLVEEGAISIEEAKRAYEGNLRLVLPYVEELLEGFRGKRVVITADHGDLFGEYGLFYHPDKIYVPELVTVPWLEVEA